MRRMLAICGLIFLGAPLCFAELPLLEELKASALKNNLSIKTKEEELKAIEAQESVFNYARFTSSYNFETQSQFYGVTVSIPFNFFGAKSKYLNFKRLNLEEAKQSLLFELEDLYLKYQSKNKELMVYETNFKEQKLKYRIAKVGFKHNRLAQEELLKQEGEFKKAEAELFKARQELRSLEERLYGLSGIRR